MKIKPIACFSTSQGQYNVGVTAHQHLELGPVVVLWSGPGEDAATGDRFQRIPAAKAIELGELLISKGQAALCGKADQVNP